MLLLKLLLMPNLFYILRQTLKIVNLISIDLNVINYSAFCDEEVAKTKLETTVNRKLLTKFILNFVADFLLTRIKF